MTKKTKAANYTTENLATLTAGYTGNDNKAEVKTLAAKVGKTEASVRAKLSNMGLYKVAKKTVTASTRVKKVDIVNAIVNAGVGLNEAERDGLEKATAGALNKILGKLTH